jgi:hypothetical protein
MDTDEQSLTDNSQGNQYHNIFRGKHSAQLTLQLGHFGIK